MKINSRIPQTKFVPTLHPALRRLLSTAATDPPLPTIVDIAEGHISESLEQFFREQYVREKPSGSVDELTTDEDAVLSYMTGANFPSVFVLCGHAGTGKTTLLLFLTTYLYSKRPDLRAAVLPIYVGLSDTAASIGDFATFEDLSNHLRSEIVRRTAPTLRDAFRDRPREALQWISRLSATSLIAQFGPVDERDAERDPLTWLSKLEEKSREQFLWDLLLFYSSQVRRVVIVFDNVDRFSRDVHARMLSFGDELRNYGVGCVCAMRHSTYKELDLLTSEKRDPSLYLELHAGLVFRIFSLRLEWAQRKLATGTLEPEQTEMMEWLTGLLKHERSTQLLAGVAGQNLHRMGKNFDRMARSNYLQSELLLNTRRLAERNQLSLVHSALFGNFHGAFKADAPASTAGVINVFCGLQGSVRPFSVFCRLNILACLAREESVQAGQLVQDYCRIFGGELSASRVILRSLFQLVTAGLVVTTRCRKIADTADIQRVTEDPSDALRLAPAGSFYINDLIYRGEYLYFMKDDTELRDDIGIGYSVADEPESMKAEGVVAFVTELAAIERELWQRLVSRKLPAGGNALREYEQLFGARGLSGQISTASFVLTIWNGVQFEIERMAPRLLASNSTLSRSLVNSLGDLVRAEVDLELT